MGPNGKNVSGTITFQIPVPPQKQWQCLHNFTWTLWLLTKLFMNLKRMQHANKYLHLWKIKIEGKKIIIENMKRWERLETMWNGSFLGKVLDCIIIGIEYVHQENY